ncbi:hypothetical protein COOONC_27396 [Cooperia oncophora]
MEPVASAEESVTAKKPKVSEVKVEPQPSEEDEPMFSEDMSEERKRFLAGKSSAEDETEANQHQVPNGQPSTAEPESELETGTTQNDVTPAPPKDSTSSKCSRLGFTLIKP